MKTSSKGAGWRRHPPSTSLPTEKRGHGAGLKHLVTERTSPEATGRRPPQLHEAVGWTLNAPHPRTSSFPPADPLEEMGPRPRREGHPSHSYARRRHRPPPSHNPVPKAKGLVPSTRRVIKRPGGQRRVRVRVR